MVPVPVTVRLVEVAVFHAVPDPAIVQVPEPTAMVRAFEFDDDTPAAAPLRVTLYVAAANVPEVMVKTDADDWFAMNASCSVKEPDMLLIVMSCVNVLPALVTV